MRIINSNKVKINTLYHVMKVVIESVLDYHRLCTVLSSMRTVGY